MTTPDPVGRGSGVRISASQIAGAARTLEREPDRLRSLAVEAERAWLSGDDPTDVLARLLNTLLSDGDHS